MDVSGRRFGGGARTTAWLFIAAAAAGLLSVLLTSYTPGFDPWSWLVWGREIVSGHLNTTGGPAFKPLPVVAAVVLSPFGHASPTAWLVLARAGGALAVLLTGRMAYRLVAEAGRRSAIAWFSGVFAAAGLVFSDGWLGHLLPVGFSEPWLAAFTLLALSAAFDGRRPATFGATLLASLLRPEAWPFLLMAAIWLWIGPPNAEPRQLLRRRLAVVAGLALVPLLWFGLDWLGSHDLLRSLHRAANPTSGGPLLTKHPWLAVLREAWAGLPPLWLALAGLTILVTIWRAVRRGPGGVRGLWSPALDRTTRRLLVLTALGVSWLLLETSMTEVHASSGESRYLLPTTVMATLLAGYAVGEALAAVGNLLTRASRTSAAQRRSPGRLVASGWTGIALAGLVLVAAALPGVFHHLRTESAYQQDSRQHSQVEKAIQTMFNRFGDAALLRRCGTPVTDRYEVPFVAWLTHLHIGQVQPSRSTGIFLALRSRPGWVPNTVSRQQPLASNSLILLWVTPRDCPSVTQAGRRA